MLVWPIISGICWTFVYLLLIKREAEDKTYGMPLAALAINIAWETRFSLLFSDAIMPLRIVNTVWFVLDILIVYLFYKHGYGEFKRQYRISQKTFYVLVTLAMVIAYGFMFTAVDFLVDLPYFGGDAFEVGKVIALGQNLMMSITFLTMYWRRNSMEGQSFYIALFKWFGTFIVGVPEILLYDGAPFIWVIVLATQVFDIWYMVLMYRRSKQEGINPWKRF